MRRRADWWLILLVIAAEVAFVGGLPRLVVRPPVQGVLGALVAGSGGYVAADLLFGLVPLLLVVGLCIFGVGSMPPATVGWVWRQAWPALLVGIGVWIVLQLVLAVTALLGGHGLALAPAWRDRGIGYLLGALLGQVLGIALHEETVYRGFLFPQLAAKLTDLGRASALILGAIISQLLYALGQMGDLLVFHPPGDRGPAFDLLGFLLLGLWFVVCYMVTENLFVCVVLHALMNQPAALVQASPATTQIALYALTILLLSIWGPLEVVVQGRPKALAVPIQEVEDLIPQ